MIATAPSTRRGDARLMADIETARDLTPDEALDMVSAWPDVDKGEPVASVRMRRGWSLPSRARATEWEVQAFHADDKFECIIGAGPTLNAAVADLAKQLDDHRRRVEIQRRVEREMRDAAAADEATKHEASRESLGKPGERACPTGAGIRGPSYSSAAPTCAAPSTASATFTDNGDGLPLAILGQGDYAREVRP